METTQKTEHAASPNSILDNYLGEKLRATIVAVKFNPTYGNAEVHLDVQVNNLHTVVVDRLAGYLMPKILADKQRKYLTTFGYNIQKLAKNAPVSDILYRAWKAQFGTYVHYVDVVPGKSSRGFYFVFIKSGHRIKHDELKRKLSQTELKLDFEG